MIIGTESYLKSKSITIPWTVTNVLSMERQTGNISILIGINNRVGAVISINDQVKQEAMLAVYSLQKMGMDVVLLTGDNAKTAEATAKKIGIREVFAEVLPNQKKDKIQQLQVCIAFILFIFNYVTFRAMERKLRWWEMELTIVLL